MLSLTRNINESIIAQTSDGPIEIIIRQVKGQQVRVGIIADRKVSIARKEIYKPAQPASLLSVLIGLLKRLKPR